MNSYTKFHYSASSYFRDVVEKTQGEGGGLKKTPTRVKVGKQLTVVGKLAIYFYDIMNENFSQNGQVGP